MQPRDVVRIIWAVCVCVTFTLPLALTAAGSAKYDFIDAGLNALVVGFVLRWVFNCLLGMDDKMKKHK